MGLITYLAEHHPQARMNRVVFDMQQSRGGVAGFRSFVHESGGFVTDVSSIGQAFISRGRSLTSGKSQTDVVLGQGIFYDPGGMDFTSLGMPGYYLQLRKQSRGQDGKPGVSTPSVPPKTPRGNKTFETGSSGLTIKPFWSSGKPKCKKGFRYDFKRKLCVKIK